MLALRLLLAVTCCGAAASKPPLRLRPSNTFKIAAFSDLHYGENEDSFGITQDINSALLMNHVLDTENLDFIVLNGDLITGIWRSCRTDGRENRINVLLQERTPTPSTRPSTSTSL